MLPLLHGVKVYEGMELWLHLFLNPALGGASGQLRATLVYLRRKSPLYLLKRGAVDKNNLLSRGGTRTTIP